MRKYARICSGLLFGSMLSAAASLASLAEADDTNVSYWYYHGERVSPADSRAVLSGATAPLAVVPDKQFGYLEQGKWTQRKQDYLLDKTGFIQPLDSGVSVMPALLQNGGTPDRPVQRALPFWRDIEVTEFADMISGLSGR